jgi:hypothetical protein
LDIQLEEALVSFSSQPIVWVEPILSRKNEAVRALEPSSESDDIIPLTDIIEHPRSMVIKAPPQFGLTCLAHYFVKEAWASKDSQFWLYLDSKNLRPYVQEIQKVANAELEKLGLTMKDVKCIVLDSWTAEAKDSYKLLDVIGKLFEGVPIVLMATIMSNYLFEQPITLGDSEFETAYLWPLSRNRVRSVVRNYNEEKHIGDEDTLTAKVVSDMEVLNIHRTPLNCMTLLKVAEVDFDDSPVNRTEMIKRVLFLLFNVDEIPTYKTRPDLKDCEFVLGYFVETLIRSGQYTFSREHFLKTLRQFCVDRILDLEVEVVFDVLHRNNILVRCGGEFCFRFSYWIFYFAAQQMYHNQEFEAFILGDMRYILYPEIIEFYTGIDRRRQNALAILIEDIRKTADEVETKCGLPDGLNPYKFAVWTPSTKDVEQMHREIAEGVLQSTLPAAVKDQYADRTYDRTRPYHQSIQNILREYSMAFMLQGIKAAGRALRNSDYVDPNVKRALLGEILRCWEQLSKVLFVLSPFLAQEGQAAFSGTLFLLSERSLGNSKESIARRFKDILSAIPANVVGHSKDDLFSRKMGSLLIDQLERERSPLRRHELILLLISQRPRNWREQVHKYISSSGKNSFYLMDVYKALHAEYRYSYATHADLDDIRYLLKMTLAKHETGNKSPGIQLIKKVPDTVLPTREVEE